MLSEKPSICITTSVAISETGIAMVGMMRRAPALQEDEDDERRRGAAPRPSVINTSCIAAETKRVVS